MTLTVNGAPRELPETAATVEQVLVALGLADRPVLVELNGTALFPRDFAVETVADGDALEIVRMVAGG